MGADHGDRSATMDFYLPMYLLCAWELNHGVYNTHVCKRRPQSIVSFYEKWYFSGGWPTLKLTYLKSTYDFQSKTFY